jgi:hypothetical protein
MGAWEIERDAARLTQRERDLGGLVDALLTERDVEEAWRVAAGRDSTTTTTERTDAPSPNGLAYKPDAPTTSAPPAADRVRRQWDNGRRVVASSS